MIQGVILFPLSPPEHNERDSETLQIKHLRGFVRLDQRH